MSEKLLPIVPGCLALTINCLNHINNNKIVRVIGIGNAPIGYEHLFVGDVFWETDHIFQLIGSFSREYMMTSRSCREKYLMRIDGFDFTYERDSYELPIANEY